MKKLLLLSAFAALMAAPAFAQEAKDKDKQKDHTDWQKKIKDELKLNDEQVAKWDALNKEYKEKIDATQQPGLDKEAQKAKKMELKKEKEAKFMEILTPEQQAKYKELMEQKKKESAVPKTSAN